MKYRIVRDNKKSWQSFNAQAYKEFFEQNATTHASKYKNTNAAPVRLVVGRSDQKPAVFDGRLSSRRLMASNDFLVGVDYAVAKAEAGFTQIATQINLVLNEDIPGDAPENEIKFIKQQLTAFFHADRELETGLVDTRLAQICLPDPRDPDAPFISCTPLDCPGLAAQITTEINKEINEIYEFNADPENKSACKNKGFIRVSPTRVINPIGGGKQINAGYFANSRLTQSPVLGSFPKRKDSIVADRATFYEIKRRPIYVAQEVLKAYADFRNKHGRPEQTFPTDAKLRQEQDELLFCIYQDALRRINRKAQQLLQSEDSEHLIGLIQEIQARDPNSPIVAIFDAKKRTKAWTRWLVDKVIESMKDYSYSQTIGGATVQVRKINHHDAAFQSIRQYLLEKSGG